MSEKEYRIKCKCGEFLDSKVINAMKDAKKRAEYYSLHMKHMFGGKMENIFQLKVNGKIEEMEYCTAFDKEWIIEEVKRIMDKTEPDDVIEIINVSKNNG